MARKLTKKEPHRVKSARTNHSAEDLNREGLEAEIEAFIKQVHGDIQDARAKMSDEEVEKADREAEAILKAASDAAKSSRHSA